MATAATAKKFLTQHEAAEYLGCTVRTIRRYIAEGRLRGHRVGPRMVRVAVDDLDALIRPIPSANGAA